MNPDRSILISYRRSDSAGHAGRLNDHLEAAFPGRIFIDVENISPGTDFVDALDATLRKADIVIVVIGPNWVAAHDDAGVRRLDDENDWVRQEVSQALTRGIRVIPVLVNGASMPTAADLPDALQLLSRRQAVAIHDTTFKEGCDRLIEAIKQDTSFEIRAVSAPDPVPKAATPAPPAKSAIVTDLELDDIKEFDPKAGKLFASVARMQKIGFGLALFAGVLFVTSYGYFNLGSPPADPTVVAGSGESPAGPPGGGVVANDQLARAPRAAPAAPVADTMSVLPAQPTNPRLDPAGQVAAAPASGTLDISGAPRTIRTVLLDGQVVTATRTELAPGTYVLSMVTEFGTRGEALIDIEPGEVTHITPMTVAAALPGGAERVAQPVAAQPAAPPSQCDSFDQDTYNADGTCFDTAPRLTTGSDSLFTVPDSIPAGTVQLVIQVEPNGVATLISPRSSAPSALVIHATNRARMLRYTPARQGGRPVPAFYMQTFVGRPR